LSVVVLATRAIEVADGMDDNFVRLEAPPPVAPRRGGSPPRLIPCPTNGDNGDNDELVGRVRNGLAVNAAAATLPPRLLLDDDTDAVDFLVVVVDDANDEDEEEELDVVDGATFSLSRPDRDDDAVVGGGMDVLEVEDGTANLRGSIVIDLVTLSVL
jgi:hypothetical protein